MSRRLIVGGQAAAVAVLVVVVYLTLLRPDGPGTLRGIEAPGGESTSRVDTAPTDRQSRATRGSGRGDGGAGGAAAGGASVLGGTPGGPFSVPAQADTPLLPGDDQYADSVKALLDKLASGGSISD